MAEFQNAVTELSTLLTEARQPSGTVGNTITLERLKVTALVSIAKSLEIIAAKP